MKADTAKQHGLLKKFTYKLARIFSIQFLYDGMQHHAMIAVRTTPFFTEYAVTMLDEMIAAQLPNNKIISASKNHLAFTDSMQENAPALMQAILQALAGQLQSVNA